MPGAVGLVSPGSGPTPGWADGLGELPGAVVCASAGAALTTRASSTVNTMCQDLIWTLLARLSARGFAIEVPSSDSTRPWPAAVTEPLTPRTADSKVRAM